MIKDPIRQRWTESGIGTDVSMTVSNRMQEYYEELRGISLDIDIVLKDKDGSVVKRVRTPGNSFLLNFMNMLYAVLTATAFAGFASERIRTTPSYNIEGRQIQYTRELAGIQAWAPKEDDTHGILIGNGTSTVTPTDTWLASQIKNGLGPGQMLYLFSEVGTTTVAGTSAYITLKRSFINHSGNDITVTELGVAVWNVNPSAYLLIIRDLIPPVDVPNDYTLDVQYTISVSV
ncbi:MAG: hypothetical protein RXO54_07315 [Acidilobus sp.]|jgi:hypothetical protein